MSLPWLRVGLDILGPHLGSVALIVLRLLPVCFLCPLFGGLHAPSSVRLGIAVTLASCLHWEAGITASVSDPGTGVWILGGVRELLFGTALGLVSALPFDTARVGGRFIDTFRGASAESSLPWIGTQEAASGEILHQLLTAVCAAGLGWAAVLHGLWRSFGAVGLGVAVSTSSLAAEATSVLTTLLVVGLAIGAPVAASALAVDGVLGLTARVAPSLNLKEAGTPLKILAGGILLWLCVGRVSAHLLDGAMGVEAAMVNLSEVAR